MTKIAVDFVCDRPAITRHVRTNETKESSAHHGCEWRDRSAAAGSLPFAARSLRARCLSLFLRSLAVQCPACSLRLDTEIVSHCFPLFPIILRNRRSSLWVGGGGRRRHVRRRRPRQRRRCAGVRFLRHCGRVRKRQRLDSAMCNYMLRGVITSALQIIARFRNAVASTSMP